MSRGPLAFLLHRLPFRVHQAEVLFNHLVELVLPYGYLLPLSLPSGLCGLLSIAYMAAIIASGSYATINWISIVAIVPTMDDAFLCRFVPQKLSVWCNAVVLGEERAAPAPLLSLASLQSLITLLFACLIAVKSSEPIRESLSPSPWLHTYDDLFIVNSYGVFGFVNSKRYVVVMSLETDLGWQELTYNMLPSDVTRVSPYCAPYHHRLDWQIWIETTASLENRLRPNFVPNLMFRLGAKLLAHDMEVASLFANGLQLLKGGSPPKVPFAVVDVLST